ncbi:DUF1853 family protein [uncultured Kordia sp.]|uniref:DUF1853 family protein n=1 Tax=uncultured Kordia sp. TaxID=507699 RepID=UPI002601FEFE|nr:DUF1853 family protein [uncultured Kordia sp.]
MNIKSRIQSITNATQLPTAITNIPTFDLSELEIATLPEIQLPTNRRLGHLVEKIVSELLKASNNYKILHENLQVIEDKNTIGELDFIIESMASKQVIHLELAYKFYVFDPTLSTDTKYCWIGPNRKDALHEKLEKLQQKQFPLLYHEATKAKLPELNLEEVSQKLCVLAYLFVPYASNIQFNTEYQKAVKGCYMDFETFKSLDNSAKSYYIPTKKEWGIDPSENKHWSDFKTIEASISENLLAKRSLLCWQQQNGSFESFFIVWW